VYTKFRTRSKPAGFSINKYIQKFVESLGWSEIRPPKRLVLSDHDAAAQVAGSRFQAGSFQIAEH
ncbi:hypothetical protein, partial [Dechloromonas denitrificans]|uniref:hypothetical protein n=1 Tax=Dechloromonas denitrificans TaxID=281362 RepID=UPI00196A15DD